LRKLFLVGMLLLSGMMAHAEDLEMNGTDVNAMSPDEIGAMAGRVWVCTVKFKGVSKGIQVIVGKFKTKAYGTLNCASIHSEKFARKIRIDINSYGIGPTVGIAYFKMRGISSQISLFNERPEDLLGKYSTTMYGGAIGAGVGYFSAFKIGMSQLAYNVSVQLLGGLGFKVGMEKMRVTAIE
jgi:hypothetical protein